MVLTIVDAATGWIEAFPVRDNSSNSVMIKCLRTVFTRFGVAETLISDNAQGFVNVGLNKWLQGKKKTESPPYFPKVNGLTKRAVQTVKHVLRAWKESQLHIDFTSYLQKVLFNHRISACCREVAW